MNNFMLSLYASPSSASMQAARTVMGTRRQESQDFFSPILSALQYEEGYHNFRPPCLCLTDVCEPTEGCTSGSPFTAAVSQKTMGEGVFVVYMLYIYL